MNPNPLSTSDTLKTLEDFTSQIGSFAVSEGKINYAEKLNVSKQKKSIAEAEAQVDAQLDLKRQAISQWASEEQARIETSYQYRKEQIEKAKVNVRNQLLEGIEQQQGHQRYDLQMQVMESAKRRDQLLAETNQQLTEQKAPFTELENKLTTIAEQAPKQLRAFPGAKKTILSAIEGNGADKIKYKGDLDQVYKKTIKSWKSISRNSALSLYAFFPIWLQVILCLLAGGLISSFLLPKLTSVTIEPMHVLIGAGGLAVLLILIWAIVFSVANSSAKKLAHSFLATKDSLKNATAPLDEWYAGQKSIFDAEHQVVEDAFQQGLQSTGQSASSKRLEAPHQVDQKAQRISDRLDQWRETRLLQIQQESANQNASLDTERQTALADAGFPAGEAVTDFITQRADLISNWNTQSMEQVAKMSSLSESFSLDDHWTQQEPDHWSAPSAFPEQIVYGNIDYRLSETEAKLPEDEQMQWQHSGDFQVPLRLLFPSEGSLLIETGGPESREQAIQTFNQIIGALLTNSPVGRVSFSLVDPVGLGESFAGLMHLSDYEEHLVNKRVRTKANQIEERLGDLCEHMEKMIQMYLRNEYETISEYNQAAQTTAERYHFLVIADFPKQFSDESIRRLLSIIKSGARCGVFTLIHYDRRDELPPGTFMEEIRRSSVFIQSSKDGFTIGEQPINLLPPPDNDRFLRWVHKIGEQNRDSNRIMVPFSTIAPQPNDFWSLESQHELRVPIGPTGATKYQELAIGKGTCQHALIAGKTGSGKSTLFHTMITNMALWFNPNQVEFYLIDFKKGVEFKAYATHRLPHARVIAIESDREFGLSVLQKLDEELKLRGEKFRALGAQDIAGYFKAGGTDPVPRTLLLIDEFQEFFVEDDQISQQAAVLLDRIVRQGRAFGIHAILGSQTLGGAFTLARATLGQMVIRIALMCNEADAYLIMDDSNPAPRLLTRPGEGIYNDQAGSAEANSPFQVAWLEDEDRTTYLQQVAKAADEQGFDQLPRVVFEGNAPAEIADEAYINQLRSERSFSGSPRLFVGAPNSIKTPTEVTFERQSGSNLMIVGQRDDVVENMVMIGIQLLKEQLGANGRFILIDGTVADPNGNSWLKQAVPWLGDSVECPAPHEIGDRINQLAAEMNDGNTPTTFLFILGLQKYKKLRHEEDFSFSLEESAEVKPSESLNQLITEGPSLGFHNIVSVDTYNNVNRSLNRKSVSEFEKKILFQMSAGDSASLIESGKASSLGMNRAIFYNEPTGVTETFRPYSQPDRSWFPG